MPTPKSTAKAQPPASKANASNFLIIYIPLDKHQGHGASRSANAAESKPEDFWSRAVDLFFDHQTSSSHFHRAIACRSFAADDLGSVAPMIYSSALKSHAR